jgi:hypothetical protein
LPSLARSRAEESLGKFRGGNPTGDRLRGLRSVEVLEHVGTTEAVKALEPLAKGHPRPGSPRRPRRRWTDWPGGHHPSRKEDSSRADPLSPFTEEPP